MTTVTVSSSSGLLGALKTAHAGDTILLAAGNYGAVAISNFHVAGSVTIASANTANQAVISALNVVGSSGLKFSNVTFATTLTNATTSEAAPYAFQVSGSSNVVFDRISAHGTLDGNPQDDVNGFYVHNSSNVTISNSQFQQLFTAITELNNTNVIIQNNVIHDIRCDGIDNGGSSNVVITGNSFSSFHPVGTPTTGGDHPDAIQFWTTNTTTAASNIVVSNNSYVPGSGSGTSVQGVFITDPTSTGLTYQNVTITGNSIVGGAGNGIDISNANNVTISNNNVIGYNGLSSVVRTENDTNISLNSNIASGYYNINTTFLSQLANQTTGTIKALTAALNPTSVLTAIAHTSTIDEYASTTGNALSGDTGSGLYLADVGVGAQAQKVLASTGATLTGSYGTLTLQANGSYSYAETKDGLTVGQTYDDHFSLTVANSSGLAKTSTLDVLVKVSGTGTDAANIIIGGAGVQTYTGGLGADHITAGSGQDTFAYTSLNDSPAAAHDTIIGFKAGDIIDLARVDPLFHIVSKFDHQAHELLIMNEGNGSWDIYGDTTGAGAANFQIHLTGATATSIDASSFHL